MKSKTRKLIWSVPLVATLAIVGALAAFVALGLPHANPVQAQAAPGVPTITSVTPGDVDLGVSWTPPRHTGSGIGGYAFQYIASAAAPAAGAVWMDVDAADDNDSVAGATFFSITELSGTTPFYVRIRANGTSGNPNGEYSAANGPHSLVTATPPSMPQNVMASKSDATTVDVSWMPPLSAGNSEGITSYDVTVNGAECAVTGPDNGTARAASCSVTDLPSYTIRVMANNAVTPTATQMGMNVATFILEVKLSTSNLHVDADIVSDTTTGGGSPQFTVTFPSLSEALPVGSSVVLYLEDDYEEPSSVPADSIYFVADAPSNPSTGSGAPVYATHAAVVATDDYFDPTKNDISIRVSIPDMCTADTGGLQTTDVGGVNDCSGPNGPRMNQRLRMVIMSNSGIKNPSEEGKHSVAVRITGSTEGVPGPDEVSKLKDLLTVAKVSLSDNNNKRGYEMIVTGTGYNDGTTATAYVLSMPTAAQWWDSLDCAEMNMVAGSLDTEGNGYCRLYANLDATEMDVVRAKFAALEAVELGANGCDVVVASGTSIGTATVGKDDTAAIPVTVSVPTFKPGKVNYICISDGESRGSGADVEVFELEDSIRVVPMEVNAGDTVTLFAEDFMYRSAAANSFFQLKLGSEVVSHSIGAIGSDGSASGTFVMPPTIGGNPIAGIIRVDAQWGDKDGPKADTKITVKPAGLTLTRTEARANESITIQGNGFSNTSEINPAKITIDGVPLMVDADSLRDDVVKISNGGQFVATIYLWPESGTTNPALVTGIHTIRVEDNVGFVGTTPLTILEPSITVVPLVAGPRDIVVIRGENFPVDNLEGGAVGPVDHYRQGQPRTVLQRDSRRLRPLHG